MKNTILAFKNMDGQTFHVVAQHVVMTERADRTADACTRLYLVSGEQRVVEGSEADTLTVLKLALEVA